MAKVLEKKTTLASVVIGFSEEEWISLQMDGQLRVASLEDEIGTIKTIHYAKIASSKEFENEPGTMFLVFKPLWWRYTDFNTEPPTVFLKEITS